MGIAQSQEELLKHLQDQIDFMIRSSKSYDQGIVGEARRLAVSIRILVHDTNRSTSLLTQLNKKQIAFLDTATPYNKNNALASDCLTVMRLTSKGAAYIAPLSHLSPSRANIKIPFDNWWSRNIVYKDINNNFFTRSSIVLNVSDKDGGAHVDPNLDEAYAKFSRFNTMGWKLFKGGISEEFNNTPVLPSIRQITYEVLKTLQDEFPEMVKHIE